MARSARQAPISTGNSRHTDATAAASRFVSSAHRDANAAHVHVRSSLIHMPGRAVDEPVERFVDRALASHSCRARSSNVPIWRAGRPWVGRCDNQAVAAFLEHLFYAPEGSNDQDC